MYLLADWDADLSYGLKIAEKVNTEFVRTESLLKDQVADVLASGKCIDDEDLHLHLTKEGLFLAQGKLRMQGDFKEMLPRLKQKNLEREMLVKAARLKDFEGTPTLLDATAGMGEDSLLLAAFGFHVLLFEHDPVIAALLYDAMKRGKENDELLPVIERMELRLADSIKSMREEDLSPDVILLDPMFPARTKSAMIKKKFQLLQQLERPCSDEMDLLMAAISANPKKIIIKRPKKGPYLGGVRPDYSLEGKAIRYDCLINITNRRV